MNEVLDVIKRRRSIRKFEARQVAEADLAAIIEAGIYAPTANNEQPWHFTVIQNTEFLREINEIVRSTMASSDTEWVRKMGENPVFQVTYGSPTLIVVSGRIDGVSWKVDCSAAIENMLLAAQSLGLGTVWLGLMRHYFAQADAAKRLGIPAGYEPFYGVSLGYSAVTGNPAGPARKTDVVNFIR